MVVVIVLVVVLALLAVFQLALAFGAPWGRFAWGGQHPGVLPTGYRIGSGVAVLLSAFISVLALDLAGAVDVLPGGVSQIGMWVVFGLLALGVLMNAISRSPHERYAATPVALVLAVLALLIALAGPIARSFAGMVLDDGAGPVFCTIVLESYPPQCGDPVAVAGWDWAAVEHEQEGSIRWGEYRFDGTRDGGLITLDGDVSPLR